MHAAFKSLEREALDLLDFLAQTRQVDLILAREHLKVALQNGDTIGILLDEVVGGLSCGMRFPHRRFMEAYVYIDSTVDSDDFLTDVGHIDFGNTLHIRILNLGIEIFEALVDLPELITNFLPFPLDLMIQVIEFVAFRVIDLLRKLLDVAVGFLELVV